jgi:hypothetical protein
LPKYWCRDAQAITVLWLTLHAVNSEIERDKRFREKSERMITDIVNKGFDPTTAIESPAAPALQWVSAEAKK